MAVNATELFSPALCSQKMKTAGEPRRPSEINLKVTDKMTAAMIFSLNWLCKGFLVKVRVKHRRAVRVADVVDLSYGSLALSKVPS